MAAPKNFLPSVTPGAAPPNTCVVSTAVAPPSAGLTVFQSIRSGTGDNNCGFILSVGVLPNQVLVGGLYLYIPAGWSGTLVTVDINGNGTVNANLSATNRWQSLQVSGAGDPTVGNVNLVMRVNDAAANDPIYTAGWVLNTPVAAVARVPLTTLQKTIPSYLYVEYNDDDDLQTFVDVYNGFTQSYVNLFNNINLPIYTGPLIVGALLDWVAQGLYGISRPTLTIGNPGSIGLFNSYMFNQIEYDQSAVTGTTTFTTVNDDIFKRIITWAFYKGDGKTFTIGWLKRRIIRFLVGTDGVAPLIDNTGQVSVSFAPDNVVNVAISSTAGPLSTAQAPILIEAINSGACELPFQYTFNLTSS